MKSCANSNGALTPSNFEIGNEVVVIAPGVVPSNVTAVLPPGQCKLSIAVTGCYSSNYCIKEGRIIEGHGGFENT